MNYNVFREKSEAITMNIIEDRRALHRIPEIDHQLPETLAYIRSCLEALSCELLTPTVDSICAWFDFGKEDAIAFRADMDALPIPELADKEYVSTHPGMMHACGHDGHMAILLELARRLDVKNDMPHNILLVFQPAEETDGGAKTICDSGIFTEKNVKAIFGLHLWPGLPAGTVASRENELMARSCDMVVEMYGKSAHIAKSWEGLDAMAAAVEFYQRTVAVEKALPENVFRLLKYGKFLSGTAQNAISNHTRMEGSVRAYQDEIFDYLQASVRSIGADVAEKTGVKIVVDMNDGFPAVMNPGDLYRKVQQIADFTELAEPYMTAEDFSWYQKYLPGMFFFLGIGNTPALHTADFDFDDSILVKGADFFENLAEKFQ